MGVSATSDPLRFDPLAPDSPADMLLYTEVLMSVNLVFEGGTLPFRLSVIR